MIVLQAHKYYWPRDGASNYALYLGELLEQSGHSIIPFAMKESESLPTPFSEYFVEPMNLHEPDKATRVQKIRFALRMLYSFHAKRQMARLLSDHHVDIAHIHNIYHHISPSIFPVLKKYHIPIVMTLHDYKLLTPNYSMFHHGAVHEEDAAGWHWSCIKNKCMKDSRAQSAVVTAEMIFQHKIMRYWERYVDVFIAPSQFMMELCVKHGWPRKKFLHIPHPLDASMLAKETTDKKYVAYVGRLSEEKGVLVLLDAAKKTPHIPYMIVGDGPLFDTIKKRMKKERLDHVTLTGFQTGDALRTLIAEARLLVVPSIWYENYPLSILEPKAMGKVIIGTHIGGIPELLPPSLLVPAGDAKALAKKIQEVYEMSSKDRAAEGAALQYDVEYINDPDTHVHAIEQAYHALLSGRSV